MSGFFRRGPSAPTYVRNGESTSRAEHGSGTVLFTAREGLMRHRRHLTRLPQLLRHARAKKHEPLLLNLNHCVVGDRRSRWLQFSSQGEQKHGSQLTHLEKMCHTGDCMEQTRKIGHKPPNPPPRARERLNCSANLGFAFVCCDVAPCLARSWLHSLSAATPTIHPT